MTNEQLPLRIDIETYSSQPIGGNESVGVYRYVASPDFEVLLFGYSWGDGPVTVLDLAGDFETIPDNIISAIKSPLVVKKAFNAAFERICLSKHIGVPPLPADSWECTMIKAYMHGLPASLDRVSRVLGGEEKKDNKGKNLIRYFSVPCKPTKANGQRSRNYPVHDWEKWEDYISYNAQDVRTEADVDRQLQGNPANEFERVLWAVDQDINDRGIGVDMDFITQAIALDERYKKEMQELFFSITGLSTSKGIQFKRWLEGRGFDVPGVNKDTRPALLAYAKEIGDDDAIAAINAEIEMSKTSVKKYIKMRDCAIQQPDGTYRVYGLLQFYGANRTGRWAGRLVQVQNLPRNSMKTLDAARNMVKAGDYELLTMLYDSLSQVLSELIRTAFVASPGKIYRVADYSAIEARGLAWLSGEEWRLKVFAGDGKIYEESASRTFNIPLDKITKDLRQQGKVTELALGYGGSVGAIEQMDSKKAIHPDDRKGIVKKWRAANRKIEKFWHDVDDAVFEAIEQGNIVKLQKGLTFFVRDGDLYITLPSGRNLVYHGVHIDGPNKFGNDEVRYYSVNTETGQWVKTSTYGAKLVENITQALCRDALAVAITRLETEDIPIVMHVHDEIVCEVDPDGPSLAEITEIMGRPISWAPGLLLPAEGYETYYYKKD